MLITWIFELENFGQFNHICYQQLLSLIAIICKRKKDKVTAATPIILHQHNHARDTMRDWRVFYAGLIAAVSRFITCCKRYVFLNQSRLKWMRRAAFTDCSEAQTSAFKLLKVDIKRMQNILHFNNWHVSTLFDNFL